MNRIDRLIAILTTLQSRKFVPASFIADKYEISIRTVYRDLKALNEIGVPVYFEPQKGYAILQEYFLPPISLTGEEANALIMIAKLSEKFSDQNTLQNVNNAIDKIKAVLKSVEREKADLWQDKIGVYVPEPVDSGKNYLTIIQQSIMNKVVLKIDYINNLQEHSEREIEPIGLTFYSNQWHLIAWCWLRKEYRDFKVLQIQKLVNTLKPFRKQKHYDLDQYIKSLS